jgi:hypothetical protein
MVTLLFQPGPSIRPNPIKHAYGAINRAVTQKAERRARSHETADTEKLAGGSPLRWRSHIIM